jgi:hypothetical protein
MKLSSITESEISQVQDFVLAERKKCLSEREWIHRLRGYGYGLRASGRRLVVTALLGDAELFEIDKAVLNG